MTSKSNILLQKLHDFSYDICNNNSYMIHYFALIFIDIKMFIIFKITKWIYKYFKKYICNSKKKKNYTSKNRFK